MATNFWKCYTCGHEGTSEQFAKSAPVCPKIGCNSEDCFPERHYRCLECGSTGDQDEFGCGDVLDDDPIEMGWELTCPKCQNCDPDRIEQVK